ncbi:MAG: hypothetical protein ACI4EQ_10830 [Lachnospiraceae bacterium]
MENLMKTFELHHFVKYIVLKVDLFESEIIDEQHFAISDEVGIARLKRKYNRRDDCVLVRIEM